MKRFCAAACLPLLAFLFLLTLPASAGVGIWTSLGPEGLDRGATWERTANEGLQALSVTAVAVDPSDPDVLYAGTESTGLLKSIDRGATWNVEEAGLQQGDPLNNVFEVLIEPTHPSTIYAISYAWLVRSRDGGETWQRFEPFRGFLTTALDPRKPGALWGAGFAGVFHSADGGEHWTDVQVFAGAGMIWQEMEVDPRDRASSTSRAGRSTTPCRCACSAAKTEARPGSSAIPGSKAARSSAWRSIPLQRTASSPVRTKASMAAGTAA